MRRLYVGGLSHSITKKDLKDRFGKFGDVQDVEIRTRRDEDGVPYKTFGYININISDADLKKCFTVLNKSKWKGGTLQIETAKESFLHRLAEERQVAAEQQLQLTAAENKRQKLLDSLSKAGVENFTMKAAVPGTEVPGHKDWVVSKFGRVLPVLQLRCQKGNRARILKYNPSKYSHNIRKLAQTTSEQATPICQLTWELQGGDDDISRKRRGEFPPYELSRPKKSRTETVISHNAAGKSRSEQTVHSVNHTKAHQFSNGFKQPPNQRLTQRRGAYFADCDVDSDEEIRRLVAAQPISHGALQQELEDDNLEVVGLDFLGCSHQQQKGRTGDKDQDDYDSADTDELLSSRKPPPLQDRLTPFTARQLSGKNTDRRRKTKNKSKAMEQEEEEDSADSVKQRSQKQGSTSKNLSNMSALPVVKLPESGSDEDDEDDEVLESDDSYSDSDYEAMFSNVTHLEISLSDLQRLAEESQLTSQTTAPSIISTKVKQETNLKSSPTEQPAPKKGTLPEEILAAIMEEDSSEDDRKKKKKKRKGVISAPLPAFQGTRALNKGSEANESLKRQTEEEGTGCMDSEAPQLSHRATHIKTRRSALKGEEIEEEENTEEEEKSEISSSSSSDDEEEEKNEEAVYNMTATKVLKTVPNKVPVSPEKSETSSSSSSDDEEEEEEQAPPRVPLGAEEEEERQRKANLRRLAAVQQRQKEAEEHKRLIQGALANLDTPTAGAGKHIIFGSDDDDDDGSDEDEQLITSEVTMSKKTLLQDSQSEEEAIASQDSTKKNKGHLKPSGPQLFGSSEDEEDDEEEDGRFDIRPQFEGRAGQKLMELQSRFGTDERFRMDSRFLEEDEDKEEESERKRSVTEEDESLEEERKKNLSILQSVLGSSQQTCSSKTAGKAKTFRDISALHYDPSKEDHAAFETKTEETKRESKSARKKKREEAQKLPEVSKEIYYDVSGDLKAVFGPTKVDVAKEKEKTNWDQEEEDESETKDEEPTLLSSIFSADPSAEKEASTGFKFSFFGDETETESRETEYKVESIQAPKVSWQQDPRFHDSSSEEDEDDDEDDDEEVEEEDVEPSSAAPKTTEEETISKMFEFFFFHPEDSRLSEGPRLFCRPSQLEEQRDQWEETRSALRQEYRKKHRDARRKLKSSQKT
ncbi:nucleolar protein 8 isoform X2 [Mastacembelus armatus]|uniref:nucleolar protein 8 isoform X2 n=1 Tax=Mastacembelus armatus TaxID=205130 RepID=UPI000E464E01|nr:nucleolar protein 8 isoform X2 [Mastacembelus armatus]